MKTLKESILANSVAESILDNDFDVKDVPTMTSKIGKKLAEIFPLHQMTKVEHLDDYYQSEKFQAGELFDVLNKMYDIFKENAVPIESSKAYASKSWAAFGRSHWDEDLRSVNIDIKSPKEKCYYQYALYSSGLGRVKAPDKISVYKHKRRVTLLVEDDYEFFEVPKDVAGLIEMIIPKE